MFIDCEGNNELYMINRRHILYTEPIFPEPLPEGDCPAIGTKIHFVNGEILEVDTLEWEITGFGADEDEISSFITTIYNNKELRFMVQELFRGKS